MHTTPELTFVSTFLLLANCPKNTTYTTSSLTHFSTILTASFFSFSKETHIRSDLFI
jgi:hypothetical protein